MKKNLVIFGGSEIAELAHFYFDGSSDYRVIAFTVDAAYITTPEFHGKPVVPFEDIAVLYPPENHELFVAVSYAKLNAVRKEKYLAAKAMGYRLASFVSPLASVLNQGKIGDNCLILENNVIQPFASIGNNVTLWSGNHIGHHAIVHDHCFLASHIVVSGGVEIGEQSFIGVNVSLRDHIKIGARCVIGAGALLLDDAEPEGVYAGLAQERSRVPSSRLKRI